jgi:hypothetical protein
MFKSITIGSNDSEAGSQRLAAIPGLPAATKLAEPIYLLERLTITAGRRSLAVGLLQRWRRIGEPLVGKFGL